MRCSRCQAENREGLRFCEDCGARLAATCPSCKAYRLATRFYVDRVIGQRRRRHLHESVLGRAVKDAVRGAGIAKPATCLSRAG